MIQLKTTLLSIFSFGLLLSLSLQGEFENTGPVRDGEVEVELISELKTVAPGETVWVGFHFRMDPKWHIYWINPGDTGLPPEFSWTLPEGVTVGSPKWPVPERYQTSDIIVDLVYEDDAVVLFPLQIDSSFTEDSLPIEVFIEWLMCDERQCIPGEATVRLEISVVPENELNPEKTELFEEARKALPLEAPAWDFKAERTSQGFRISFSPGDFSPEQDNIFFFTEKPIVAPSSPQRVRGENGRYSITLVQSEHFSERVDSLVGILTGPGFEARGLGNRPKGFLLDLPLEETEVGGIFSGGILGFIGLISLAFLGGMILNLMPCVFPILGIKVMGFVQQGGKSRAHVALHGLTFTAGVLVSFWILSIILIALRAGGTELGWGFQLQEPGFNFVLILILLVFALNLSGLFEFGLRAVGLGNKLTGQSGWSGSFFSGALATVVATPCSAPFLAPALGAALALPALDSLIMFTAIAMGLSAPYLILSIFPQLAAKLPKPGAWMESFKQLMAFPLYATVAYLVWVMAGQVDSDGFLNLVFGLIGVSLAVWIYGRWTRPEVRKKRTRRIAIGLAILTMGVSLYAAYPREAKDFWQPWSEQILADLREENRWVYVDFTARWCATCQTNKRAVFSSNEVLETFRRKGIVPIQADWTNRDPAITRALAGYGRSAIPVNILYYPGATEGIILPELLTPGIVLDTIERAAEKVD